MKLLQWRKHIIMILTQRQCGCPTGYYILCNTTWTAKGFVAKTVKGELSHRTTSQLSYSGGRVQYKFVVSKLHCKINFMSTFVPEGNRVTNCQVLILKINVSYLPINVFTNFSHDLFLISKRNLEREKKKEKKKKTLFLVNESVSFHFSAFKPSVVTRYCYVSGLASFRCCWLLFYSVYIIYIYCYMCTKQHRFTYSHYPIQK